MADNMGNDNEEQHQAVGEEGQRKPSEGRRSLWMVYVAHALSTWGDNL